MFGKTAYTSDDGSVQQDVLALKVPELVSAALSSQEARIKELEAALSDLLRDGIVLSWDYLETFKDWADDDTVQGWHKRDWIKARKAADKARKALEPK